MISENEINVFLGQIKKRNPANLFEVGTLQATSRGLKVKLGTRKIYVDYPRIAYSIQQWTLGICSEKIQTRPLEEIEKVVEEINNEKTDQKTELGFLTQLLEKLGIKWNCVYLPWYKKPVLKFNANGYFKRLWATKLRQFVKELSSGEDSPVEIYQKAQTLTPEYKKLFRESNDAKSKIPKIFDLFLNEINPHSELEYLWKTSQKLVRLTNPYEHGNVMLYQEIDKTFMDTKTIIHQIYATLESGHCFSGYFLLRKVLTNFALIIFYDSFINWILDRGVDVRARIENEDKDILSTYISEFPQKWASVYVYPDMIAYRDVQEAEPSRYFRITDLNAFTSKYRKDELLNELLSNYVELKDRFLREVLDVVAAHSVDVFEFAERNISLDDKNKIISDEYSKLSEVIHEPIYIDFPPFSSLLEYAGFLHHLRKVRFLLDIVVRNYRKFKRTHRAD